MEQEFITAAVSPKSRGSRVQEFIAALRAAWGPDPVSFQGHFYRIPLSKIDLKPVQEGGIPILLGGFADGLNPIAISFEMLQRMVSSFRSAAQAAGRDPSRLTIVVRANVPITAQALPASSRPFLGGSPDQIAQDLARVQSLAVDHVLFANQAPSSL